MSNMDYILKHPYKERFLECKGYDDSFKDMGTFVALVVDECMVGETKHVQLQVLGSSDAEYWDWVLSGGHPNPGWYYWTSKPLKGSSIGRVSTT